MRIGTAISLMALAHPVDLAEQLATLDILSGGRLTVGAGLGYRDVEFDAFGVPRDRRLRRLPREPRPRTQALDRRRGLLRRRCRTARRRPAGAAARAAPRTPRSGWPGARTPR